MGAEGSMERVANGQKKEARAVDRIRAETGSEASGRTEAKGIHAASSSGQLHSARLARNMAAA